MRSDPAPLRCLCGPLAVVVVNFFEVGVHNIVVDRRLKIVTTPAYMYPARIREARTGIQKLVAAVLGMA